MTILTLQEEFAYYHWANARLCAMLHNAFGEDQNLHKSYSRQVQAIHEAAVHIVGAEQVWRLRIEGISPDSMLSAADYPNVPEIQKLYEAEKVKTQKLLDSLHTEDDLNRIVAATSTKGEARVFPLRVLLHHIVNHASYHRGQITAYLIALGHDEHIIPTDFTAFYMEYMAE